MKTPCFNNFQMLTVGIPFYAKTEVVAFCAAIESILSQSIYPDEIHLIQDGLITDDLDKVVKHYLESFPCMKHILIPNNLGLAHALNFSILNAKSKYYARMDSDDIAHPQRFERQIQFLELHTNIDILGTWALEFENEPCFEQGFIRKVPTEKSEMEKLFHYRNPFIHPTVMFRRNVFTKIGLYNETFKLEEDLELWSRAFRASAGVANLPEVLLYYRFSGSIKRRASAILYQIKARYQYNTFSAKLNFLKILSVIFRLLPTQVQEWAYQNLRA